MKKVGKLLAFLLVVTMLTSVQLQVNAQENEANSVTAVVTEVQKYGNLTMDITPNKLYDMGFELGDMLKVTVRDEKLSVPLCTSYSDVDTGSLLVRAHAEKNVVIVAINMGNFASTYDVKVGDTLTFELEEKEAYLAQYLLHQLERTNNRDDYAMDSIFANFRNISTTGIKPGVLYRSASPINNEIGRAAYADELVKAVGVNTIVNLADNATELEGYVSKEDFNSPYYYSLYQKGCVKLLDMTVDLSSEDFGNKLANGFKFMASKEGPYLVHCTEGKDRAGFVSAVLECLMGASLDEVKKDYMITYKNYYNVEDGSEQYYAIEDSNIVTSLTTIVCGLEKGADISNVNLSDAAEKYLMKLGLTMEEIAKLKANLSVEPILNSINVTGEVTEIEKYGHTSTDIKIADFNKLGFEVGDMVTVIFDNGFTIEAPYVDGYYVEKGDPLVRAYKGHDTIAVCINYGKLFKVADVQVGDKVTIMMSNPQGYKTEYEVRNLERTNNRDDYATDEIFANFRNIISGNLAKGVLYRSASPINNELGRAKYANKLVEKAGVKTIVNMADSDENIAKYRSADDFDSKYYATLYDNKEVITLNMGLAYSSDDFKVGIKDALVFMANNEGPYLFHCTEGKDRTGFMGALLGALMGATQEEIVNDYMQSYINYYNVEVGSEQYKLITKDVIGMLKYIEGVEDLDSVDLAKGAKEFILNAGMTEAELTKLMTNLSTEMLMPEKSEVYYIVIKNDTLWKISNKELGNGSRYMDIYNMNKKIIKNPNLIFVGQELLMPEK